MIKHLILILILLIVSFDTRAQNFNDQVDKLLKEAWDCYETGNYQCMIEKSKNVLTISKKHNIPRGIAEAYYYLGIAYFSQNQMSNALKYTRLAVEYAEKQKNYRWIVYSYTLLGEIFRFLGKKDIALQYFKKSLKYAQKNKNKKMVPIILINIANIHFENGKYNKALKIYENALKLVKKENLRKSYEALIYYNIGLSYYKTQKFEYAKKYLMKSAQMYKTIGNQKNYLESIYFLARSYLALDKKKEAEKIIKQHLKMAKNHGFYNAFYKLLKN